jgi:adenosylcobinamide-phosphate synthase
MPAHLVDRILVLLLAFALDALVGDMPFLFARIPHPVVLAGKAIAMFDARLNRENRSEPSRRMRGVVTLLVLTGAAALLGWVVSAVFGRLGFGWTFECLCVTVLLAGRSLYEHVARVAQGLEHSGIEGGRQAVRHIVGRDPESLDEYAIARAAIESLAENFSDGVVAPALAYVAAGLPGLFVYKMVNTLDSMIGHRNPRYRAFGWASARCDDLLNLIPARLAGFLIGTAALFIPRGDAKGALRIMWRDHTKHRSPNGGWPESAIAGALGLALLGPRHYGQVVVDDPWLGDGRARATPGDIRRALNLYVIACLILVGLLAGLAVIAE